MERFFMVGEDTLKVNHILKFDGYICPMKTVLITGASSGIGKASAIALAGDYNLVLISRNIDKVNAYAKDLKGSVRVHQGDVRDANQMNALVNQTVSDFGRLDVLINNAGLGYFDRIDEGSLDQWHEMVDTNIKGILNCLHPALPHLKEVTGHVINLGSIASHHVFPNSGVYSATKHAVFAISESIRVELMGQVKVTTISPGAINTDFINKTTNEELLKSYKEYFETAMNVSTIATQIKHAIETDDNAVVNEIIIRPFRKTMR